MQHQNMSARGVVVAGAAALAVLAWPGAVTAQGIFGSPTAPPAVQEDSAAAGPKAIPLSEIPLKVDEALARLQTIETQLSVDPDLALIEEDLPEAQRAVSRSHARIGQTVLAQLSIRELGNLTAIWESHESTLRGWADTFGDELRETARVAEIGEGIRDTWRVTSESLAREEDVPEAVVAQVERVLSATRGLESIIRNRLSYLVGVKSELDDGLDGVRHVLGELQAAQVSVRRRVLTRTDVPIWRLGAWSGDASERRTTRIAGAEWEAVQGFVASGPRAFLLSALFFVVIVLILIRIRRRIGTGLDLRDESLRGAADTLDHPISAALLLTILLTSFAWPPAPYVFWQVVSVVAIVPIYRLIPPSANPVINRTVRALLVVFALAAVADLLIPTSIENRLVILLASLLLAGVAGWLIRGADGSEMRQTTWGHVVWRGLQASLAVGVISAVANITGWALLAEILVMGILYSAYIGLGIVIGYRIVAGLIRLLPQTALGRSSRILSEHGDLVTSRAITVTKIAAVALWIWIALGAFEIADPMSRPLAALLTGEVHIGAVTFSLQKALSFAVVILLAIWLARFVTFVLDVEVLPRLKLKRGVSSAISTVVQWSILGAGLLTAASALGLQAGQLAIVFGALSVGIGFGLQNVVSNFVSGLILIFEQPVKVGDKVEITSLSLIGEVRRIGIRASVVRTFDGAEVIVPNSNLISSEVVNWTLSDQRRRTRVEIGVQYGTDPDRVIDLLVSVAREHPEVLRYPEPNVLFMEHGASSLNFRLQFWTANFDDFFRIRSEMTVGVNKALREAGITIPFPQQDVYVKSLPGTAPPPKKES
jgi:small-conductance mechanosensitive channel